VDSPQSVISSNLDILLQKKKKKKKKRKKERKKKKPFSIKEINGQGIIFVFVLFLGLKCLKLFL